jgi:deoxyribodipyrimidine photolyase-related protein
MTHSTISVWILGDQLLARHPALAAAEETLGRTHVRVVLVESAARAARLPYQRKKLVLLFSAMRHYAEELRQQGWLVDHIQADTMLAGLRQHVARHQPARLLAMAASEAHGRSWQTTRLADQLGLPVVVLPNTQFLTGQFDPYPDAGPDQRVVMEHFYRAMRRHFHVLLTTDGQPVGGEWNYDRLNRQPLPKGARLPAIPRFEPDEISRQVMREVAALTFATGSVEGFDLAVTRQQALAAFEDFLAHRLPGFGPYEDAMSSRHATLYHSVLSPYLNIGLLEPMELVRAAEHAYHQGQAPINSVEGFVRQIIGWREYMAWQYWRLIDMWGEANAWNAHRPLPPWFWIGETEMNCLAHAIRRAIDTGYTHHIERLMLLSNFALLAGIAPMAVNDWFLSSYVDAYEWVMLPNVIGMGLNADGGRIATKPYIASANYIHKMSDYCGDCCFDHKARTGAGACPFNFLYWNFLLEHEQALRGNPRLGRNVLGLRHLGNAEREQVRQQAAEFLSACAEYIPPGILEP